MITLFTLLFYQTYGDYLPNLAHSDQLDRKIAVSHQPEILLALIPKGHTNNCLHCHSSGQGMSIVVSITIQSLMNCWDSLDMYCSSSKTFMRLFRRWILKCTCLQALSWNVYLSVQKFWQILLLHIFGMIFRSIFLLHQNFDICSSTLLVCVLVLFCFVFCPWVYPSKFPISQKSVKLSIAYSYSWNNNLVLSALLYFH